MATSVGSKFFFFHFVNLHFLYIRLGRRPFLHWQANYDLADPAVVRMKIGKLSFGQVYFFLNLFYLFICTNGYLRVWQPTLAANGARDAEP